MKWFTNYCGHHVISLATLLSSHPSSSPETQEYGAEWRRARKSRHIIPPWPSLDPPSMAARFLYVLRKYNNNCFGPHCAIVPTFSLIILPILIIMAVGIKWWLQIIPAMIDPHSQCVTWNSYLVIFVYSLNKMGIMYSKHTLWSVVDNE